MRTAIVTLLLLITTIAVGQNYKWKSDQYVFKTYYQSWDDVDWEPTEVVISVTLDDDQSGTCRIYSKTRQIYTLIYTTEVTKGVRNMVRRWDSDGGKYITVNNQKSVIEWQAEDSDGTLCIIRFLNFEDDYWADQIVILYEDYQWAYTLNKL